MSKSVNFDGGEKEAKFRT